MSNDSIGDRIERFIVALENLPPRMRMLPVGDEFPEAHLEGSPDEEDWAAWKVIRNTQPPRVR